MEKNIIKNHYGRKFEIVESFPEGAFVWNIGRHNFPHECYVPLAFLDTGFSDLCHVDVKRLKAIKVKSEKIALNIIEMAGEATIGKKEFEDVIDFYELREEIDNFWKDKKDYESTPQSAELMANNID